jgi:hypothetical protein
VSTLQEIEQAIDQLPRNQAFKLGEWLDLRLNNEWDDQFESDVKTGRLDKVAQEALKEHRAGNSKNFPI